MGQQLIDNTIFRTVLKVPEYRDMFFRKLGDIFQTFTTEYMTNILDECLAEMYPETEMKLHFSRWAEFHDKKAVSEWPTNYTSAYAYWEKHVNRLKNVIKKRPNLLWGMIQEQFKLTNAQMEEYFGPRPEMPADAV